MLALVFADRGAVYKRIKIGHRSSSSQASAGRANGRVAKGATKIHDVVQETRHSLFRSIRSDPLRTLVSIGTCHEQHDRRSISDAFLSATWLALLGHRRSGWLLENLPWRALAERRDCDPVFGDW